MRLPWFGAAGVALALVSSCLLDLDHEIACGDGHVDALAGEECDPAKPSSYVDRCAGTSRPDGQAACDALTCTVINDKAQCATCGDESVDAEFGEECDGQNLNGQTVCPGGGDGLQCGADCKFDYSECDPCGNGMREDGEECDPEPGDIVIPQPCDSLDSMFEPYTWGDTITCTDCRYDRSTCSFCGDGTRDDSTLVDVGVSIPAEWCDGDIFDPARLLEQYGDNHCTMVTERPNVGCADDCRSFVQRWPEENRCCRKQSETCPVVGEDIRCCHEYAHPDEEPCEEFFEGMVIRRVCR